MGCNSSSIKDTTIPVKETQVCKKPHTNQINQTNRIGGAETVTYEQMSSIKSLSGDGVYRDRNGNYSVGGDRVIFNSDRTILSIGGSAPHNWGSVSWS